MKPGFRLAIAGTFFYSSLFVGTKFFTLKYLSKKYKYHEIVDVANKIVSSTHAVCSCIAGFVIVLNCGNDIKYDNHWMTNGFAWFGFPYFLYDIFSMFHVYKNLPENEGKPISSLVYTFLRSKPVIISHHFILATLGLPAIVHFRHGLGDYYIGCFYLAELSTPFVSFRAILSKLNKKKTTIYAINGFVMIIVFFICRVCLFPYLYYKYAIYANLPVLEVPLNIPKKCNVCSALFVLMQLYWFYMMVRGAVKLLCTKRDGILHASAESSKRNE